ncbi:DUF4974 domain-containing protein [Bordetella petrii]|nr:DUF4974 domain-containing protein [Bordetella petrii]
MRPDSMNTSAGAIPDTLQDQAWEWLRLLTSRAASQADLQAFQAWVDTSPAHLSAYRQAKDKWDALAPAAGMVAQAVPDMLASFKRRRARNRRTFLGMGVAAAGAAAVAIVHPPLGLWPALPEWDADYRTATGEQRSLGLEAGVAVMLNTRTSARRRTEDGRLAGLELLTGEAAIDLQAGRRFSVAAGVGRSQSESGQFEVRYLDGQACVTCMAGTVTITHPQGQHALPAGQQIIYDDRTISVAQATDIERITAWRRGLLMFRNVRLAEVIDDINRYRPGHIVLTNERARGLAVNGQFRIDALDHAIEQLAYSFDLNQLPLPGGVVLLG